MEDEASYVDILLWGDLSSQVVVDMQRRRSEKIRFVARELRRGHHVHVIDSPGLAMLLRGEPTPCLAYRLVSP